MQNNSDQDPDFIPDTSASSDSEEEAEIYKDAVNNTNKENCEAVSIHFITDVVFLLFRFAFIFINSQSKVSSYPMSVRKF